MSLFLSRQPGRETGDVTDEADWLSQKTDDVTVSRLRPVLCKRDGEIGSDRDVRSSRLAGTRDKTNASTVILSVHVFICDELVTAACTRNFSVKCNLNRH